MWKQNITAYRTRILHAEKSPYEQEGKIISKTLKKKKKTEITNRPTCKNVKRSSLGKRKIIQVRNLNLHRERKNTGEGKNEGKIEHFISLIFNGSQRT